MEIENVDVLVIGAGPAGCVASSYLNSKNSVVKVVEKAKFPRPVIGESFIPKVMDNFDEINILPAIENAGFEVKDGSRFIRGDQSCLFEFDKKFGEGWNYAYQVPRADFDLVVADEVQKQGVEIEFECEAVDVAFYTDYSLTTVQDKKNIKKQIKAKYIVDSSGYGRVLPHLMKLDAPSSFSGNSSIFVHTIDKNRPKGKEGTQITFDIVEPDTWLWVIPFSNGVTSLGIVGPTPRIEALSKTNDVEEAMREGIRLSSHYKERFRNNDFLFPPIMKKNYSCSVSQLYGKGFVLTGNSATFLDPVFSSGVAIATESSLTAAKLIVRELNGEKVDWETEYKAYIKRGVDVFETYVKEFYNGNLQKLFFHKPVNWDIREKICAVLAGYVWNEENPFVTKHKNVIKNLAYAIDNKLN